MLSTLVLWLVYAVFLKLAVGLATDVDGRTNSLGRAFVTAAVLSVGHGLLAKVGGIVMMLWPIAWLFIIKHTYDIGWFRSILVWLSLVLIAVAVVFLVLIPLGLAAVTGGAIALAL